MATAISMLQDLAAKNVHAMDSASGTSSGSDTSNSAATITSNDFLTLLVTEMKNQDPTATMDPNEYINQLVNVNSLQQLISINQTLSDALGSSSAASATGQTLVPVTAPTRQAASSGAQLPESAAAQAVNAVRTHSIQSASPLGQAMGSFTIPPANPNARAVAEAFTAHGVSRK